LIGCIRFLLVICIGWFLDAVTEVKVDGTYAKNEASLVVYEEKMAVLPKNLREIVIF